MAVISGKNGTLFIGGSAAYPCSNWTIDLDGNLKEYAANNTAGWVRQVCGVRKASGTFLMRADDDCHCPVSEGSSYVAQFHMDAGGDYYNGRIAIASIGVDVDINDGEIVNYVVNWNSDGPITEVGMPAEAVGCSSSSGA